MVVLIFQLVHRMILFLNRYDNVDDNDGTNDVPDNINEVTDVVTSFKQTGNNDGVVTSSKRINNSDQDEAKIPGVNNALLN